MKKIILIKICLSLCMFSGINHNVIHSQQPVTKVSANPPDWELGGGWWSWDWCEDGWLDCDPGHHFELDWEIITPRQGNGHPWVECHPLCSCNYNGDGGNDVYTSWSAWWYELVNPYSPWTPWWGWSTDIGGGEGIDLGGAGGNSGGSGGGSTGSNEEAGDGTGGGIDGGNDGTIVIGDKDPPILPPTTMTVTDCAGVMDGTAYIDECGNCVGGTTANTPCNKKTAAEITAAAQSAVQSVKNEDPPGTIAGKEPARCNKGVQYAFKALFGNSATELDNKTANDMVNHWEGSADWEEILPNGTLAEKMNRIQELANEGWFVVAGWKNPTSGSSGHVSVIVPGTLGGDSASWGQVPQTMDTGNGRRTDSVLLSKCYYSNSKNNVKFYKYK